MKNKTLAIAVLMAIIPTINIVKMDAKTITLPAEEITMTEEWDKVFPKSDKVDHRKVTFPNRYGITLVADLYIPKNAEGPLPAIAVRTFRRCQGTVVRTLCSGACRKRFLHPRFRPVVHRRERRPSTLYDFARHQH